MNQSPTLTQAEIDEMRRRYAAAQAQSQANMFNQQAVNAQQAAMNQHMGHAAMGVGPNQLWTQPVRWQDRFTWAQLRNKDPELAAFVEATANLLDCEIDSAMSPMTRPTVPYLGGRPSRIRDIPMIWMIHHPKLNLSVQWMEYTAPLDEAVWRDKFAQMGALIEDEREYQKAHPEPPGLTLPPPPPTYQAAQIAGTVVVQAGQIRTAVAGSTAGSAWGGVLGFLGLAGGP